MKDERGQSLVETALVLPLLLLLIVGIFDFGRLLYSYAHLHMATQETVRQGGLGARDQEMVSFARSYIDLNHPEKLKVVVSPTEVSRSHGDYVTVKLTYPYTFTAPIISSLFPSPFSIETESTIRVE